MPHQHHLSDRDREALHLAHDLRIRMAEWMSDRGLAGTPVVSPYIDPSGLPSVLVQLNSYVARAMVLSLGETSVTGPRRSPTR
ncbi:hypothetical protein GCM10009780_22980 [Actinomadura alba]